MSCDNLGKQLARGADMPGSAKTRTSFAERLLRFRKAKGLTQEELAELSGISRRVVALYETKIKGPSADVVLRLAKALGLSADQLMGQRPVKNAETISRQTLKKAKMIEELPTEDRKTVERMIDSFHAHATKKT
jgi:transcriptional regulator with XRE-family HTH domain